MLRLDKIFNGWTLLFITLAVLVNIFYDTLKDAELPIYQIIYLAHFNFYAALSFMFLAFKYFANLGSVYQAIEEYKVKNHTPEN